MCTDSCAQNKRCHCRDQIRCWMLMCTSQNRRHRRSMACSIGSINMRWSVFFLLPILCSLIETRTKTTKNKNRRSATHELSSFLKYEILSPHRFHPTFESLASVMEYINGRMPSLYRLPDFTKFTIDSLFFWGIYIGTRGMKRWYMEENRRKCTFFRLILCCVIEWLLCKAQQLWMHEPVCEIFPCVCHTKIKPLRVFVRV